MNARIVQKDLESVHLKAGKLVALGTIRVRNSTEGGLRMSLRSDGTLEISECCLDGEEEITP